MTGKWRAEIILRDQINNREAKFTFSFSPLYTYNSLYDYLPNMLLTVDWQLKYEKKNTTFILRIRYGNQNIHDWSKFLIHGDCITVIFTDPHSYSYALYTRKFKLIFVNKDLQTIYNQVRQLKRKTWLIYLVDGSYRRIRLMDVLDNAEKYYNHLVNRLIKNYYVPYKITL